jgi:hypothetical protein
MTEFFASVWNWIKSNMLITIGIAIVLVLVLFSKSLKKLFGNKPRRRRRMLPRSVNVPRRHVATHRMRSKKRKEYNKDGTQKKAWQIKGSEAARRHMAKIRSMR